MSETNSVEISAKLVAALAPLLPFDEKTYGLNRAKALNAVLEAAISDLVGHYGIAREE
jgi:hypothetical protein